MHYLENKANMIKGYLLNHTTPPEIMQAIDDILRGISSPAPRSLDAKQQISIEINRETFFPNSEKESPADDSKQKLQKDRDLEEVQRRHDLGESNGSIAMDYDCSDQTVVNFLKKNGNYVAKAKGGRRRTASAGVSETNFCNTYHPPEVKPTDIMGEPLISVHTPRSCAAITIEPGILQPGDLVDIHDMLSEGMSTDDIAEKKGCTKKELEAFILKHRNVQITKCKASGNAYQNSVVKPAGRGKGSGG